MKSKTERKPEREPERKPEHKPKYKIVTGVLALCGIIGIYVATSESLHNKANPENTNSGKITSNTGILTSKENSKDSQLALSHNPPTPSETHASETHASETHSPQTQASLARPALSDIRSLDIIDKLNSFDGSENAKLRLAFALNEDYDFQAIQSKQDRKGNQHTRYQQTYRDVPVWGEQVLVHQDTPYKGTGHKGTGHNGAGHKNTPGDYYSANGKVASGLEFSELDAQLANIDRSEDTLQKVIRSAKETNQHLSAQWATQNAKSELVIYVDEQGQAKPAYAVSYLAMPRTSFAKTDTDIDIDNIIAPIGATPEQLAVLKTRLKARKQQQFQQESVQPTRPHMLIDAASNQVIKQWEGLNTADAHGPGGNEKTGRYEFGTDYPPLLVGQAGDTCTLNNHKVKTVDLQHNFFLDDKAFSYPCAGDNNENNHKEINGAYSPLNDAHFFGGLVFDMFQDWFYLTPLNFQLTMAVHFDQKFNNAFWTGAEMVFGDGFNVFYPLVDVNVSAHEVAHGFTEQNSGLIYFDESGGMNEAFSDIAGEAAEFYWQGEVDWLVGSDIFVGDGSLRYFEDPTLDGVSIGHADDFFPFLDVHYSSGVYNRAFYLLANTANWDVRKAFEVFVLANQFYWEPSETFDGGACGVLSAANDLGFEVRDVDAAFQTVGVDCGAVPFTDSDRDGMDNLWEMRFDLNPRDPNDAYTDADGDGLVNVAEYHERSNPQNPDSDGDGINDLVELYVHKTNPNLSDSDYDGLDDFEERETWLTNPAVADTDKDGMPDGWEVKFGLAPRNPDAENDMDGDGVSNLDEFTHQADPTLVDSDGDGLDDYAEINTHLTKPNLPDSDRDGLNDADELGRGTDPNSRDTDNDYLGDGKEIEVGSDPFNRDTDNDSLPDGDEVSLWLTSPLESDTDFDGMPDVYEIRYPILNPRVADGDQDPDQDGLSNLQEYELGVDPGNADTDNDTLNDGIEIFESKTDPNNPDTDGDTLLDGWEFHLGLDPLDIEDATLDSDGDGWLNIQEFQLGTHPLSATEAQDGLPAKPRASEEVAISPDGITECVHINSEFAPGFCYTSGFTGPYGWDGRFNEEGVIALNFRSALPWTVESGYLRFSASISQTAGDLTAVITQVDELLPLSTFLANEDFTNYWEKIKNGPQLDSLTIGASQDSSLTAYETARFDLPPIKLNTQGIAIGKSISNLQKIMDRDEMVRDSDNVLMITFAPDADEDGITDEWEAQYGLDPTNPADALEDRDQDGASNLQEYILGTDLDQPDSDGDGMPDGWEVRYGLDPHIDDSLLDKDADGLSNLAEFKYQSSPLKTDSDGDGIDDKLALEMRMTAQYDEQYQAPVCHAAQLQCRSGDLLSGRGDVNITPEVNAPNTLYGACLDGNEALSETGGSALEDTETDESEGVESANNWIESIVIASTDLLELGVEKTAEISVELNSDILFDNEYLDIYYTTNVEQPEWNLLQSFRLAAQTVNGNSNEYTLPIRIPTSTESKHAIRASYRYGDSPAVCGEDTRVDHDDLVFTVHTEPNPVSQAPVVKWTGLSDTYSPIELRENTLLSAIAMDEQNVKRVVIELFNSPDYYPVLFSHTFDSPPYQLNWSDIRLPNDQYFASIKASYDEGEIARDELDLDQSYKSNALPDWDFTFPRVSLISPLEYATVQGEVTFDIAVTDSSGVNHLILEVIDDDRETVFSRTFFPEGSGDTDSGNSDPYQEDIPIPAISEERPTTFRQEIVWDSTQVPPGHYRIRYSGFSQFIWNFSRSEYSIYVEASESPDEAPGEDEAPAEVEAPAEDHITALTQ